MIRLEMKNYNMILTKKLQKHQHFYQVKWISYRQINIAIWLNYNNRTSQVYLFSFRKCFEKEAKMNEDQEENQTKAIGNSARKQILDRDEKSLTNFFSKHFSSEKAIYELNRIKEIEQKINKDDLVYKAGDKEKDKTCYFQKFKTIKSFGGEIFNDCLKLEDAE